jgi:TPP-dependent pyruvate/acetoin dehydrogenase alpha subunit
MLQARLFEDHLAAAQKKSKSRETRSMRGQEACRVSLIQGLIPGDLVIESTNPRIMDLLLSTTPFALLAGLKSATPAKSTAALLAFEGDVEDRMHVAFGAALALKAASKTNLLVVFMEQAEARHKLLRKTFAFAAEKHLPIIFVALPGPDHDGHARLTRIAHAGNIPGIAVEATDAIALYRVAQESANRMRTDGGPILIEGIGYHPGHKHDPIDPVAALRKHLLARKVSTEQQLLAIESSLTDQLTKSQPPVVKDKAKQKKKSPEAKISVVPDILQILHPNAHTCLA